MSVLVFDKATKARIEQVKQYAQEHQFSQDQLRKIMAGRATAPGEDDNFVIHIPGTGMRLVVTLEDQPCGLSWHVSLSIPKPKAHASPNLIEPLFDILGLDRKRVVGIWLEPYEDTTALNIVTLATSVDPKSN